MKGGMNGSACAVPVPYIAMAARGAVRVQLYGNSTTIWYQYSEPVQLCRNGRQGEDAKRQS